jgi:hypothetical protein
VVFAQQFGPPPEEDADRATLRLAKRQRGLLDGVASPAAGPYDVFEGVRVQSDALEP